MGFMMKRSGAWVDASKVYKKISGAWVEQTDLVSVIPDNVRYQNGGEYVPPIRTVTVIGRGETEHGFCYVAINGAKIMSPGTFEVNSGMTVDCKVAGIGSGGIVKVNGEQVYSGNGTYSYTVTSDCTIILYMNQSAYRGEITINTA